MIFKHYYSKMRMTIATRNSLLELVDKCGFIYEKTLCSVVSPIVQRSIICAMSERGEVLGFASIEDQEEFLFLAYLYVAPENRNKGIGGKLLDCVKKYAKFRQLNTVELIVGRGNEAIKLYERKRFLKISKRNSTFGNGSFVMKMYSSSKSYHAGAILNELSKRSGQTNLSSVAESLTKEDYSMFYDFYRSKKKDDLIEIMLKSDAFKATCKFLEKGYSENYSVMFSRILMNDSQQYLTEQER